MTTRELFEAEFPVMRGLYFVDVSNLFFCRNEALEAETDFYNAKWIGFQAGYKAKESEK